MILPILTYPNPSLAKSSVSITIIDTDLCRFADDMAETMYYTNGMGLAAPQVGRLLRMVVVDIGLGNKDQKSDLKFMFNPVISVFDTRKTVTNEEGCLSLPGILEKVTRCGRVLVKYMDKKGESQDILVEGLAAACIQHEIDHLNGKLFVDNLSKLKKQLAIQKYLKNQEHHHEH